MRQMRKDTTDLYAGGIAQQNYINNQKQKTKSFAIKRKVGNSLYLEEDLPEEIGVNQSVRGIQRLLVQSMIEKYNQREHKNGGEASYILPRNFVHRGSAFGQLLYKCFMEFKLPNRYDYQGFCINNKKIGGFYMLSRESTNSEWFDNLILPQNKRNVDQMCAEITAILFYLLGETLKDRVPSFKSTVLTFLQNNQLKSRLDLFNLMPESPICYVILFDFLKDTFSDKWLPSVISNYIQSSIEEVDDTRTQLRVERIDDRDVNRCVGWGPMHVIRKDEKKHKNESDDGESENVLRILQNIKVLKDEILGNAEYIWRYYPLDDTLRNKGFLTLILPNYIDTWSQLFPSVKREINLDAVKTEAADGTIKNRVVVELTKGSKIGLLTRLSDISEQKAGNPAVPMHTRQLLFWAIVEITLNMKIGAVVRQYRLDVMHRKGGDVTFRKKISVLAQKCGV